MPVAGAELVPHLLNERTLETHGPYQHGNGFAATNGGTDLRPQECASKLPVAISHTVTAHV